MEGGKYIGMGGRVKQDMKCMVGVWEGRWGLVGGDGVNISQHLPSAHHAASLSGCSAPPAHKG